MSVLTNTYDKYIESYKDRLTSYINKWVDNTATSFLEIELNKYNDYYSSLIKISDYFKNKSTKDLRVDSASKDAISDLKDINEPVFNEIFKIEKTKVVTDKVELNTGYVDEMIRGFIPGKIEIDLIKLENYITSAKKILGFINKKLKNPSALVIPENITDIESEDTVGTLEKQINKYPQIFLNPKAYELFEKLHDTYKDTKTPIADYSFIYRVMYDDNYILDSFKPQMFINWLSKHYEIELSKVKTKDRCYTESKIQYYNTLKGILQIK